MKLILFSLSKLKMGLALTTEQFTIAAAVCIGIYFAVGRTKVIKNPAKVVLIGASSGIGKEIALQLSCDKVIVARRETELNQVASSCSGNTIAYAGDITKTSDMQQLLEFSIQKLGKVDTLIICSGVLSVLPFEDLPMEIISKVMEINAVAPIITTKIFLKELIRNTGQIIVVSSASGTLPAPTRTLYTASKHAVTGFFRSLRIELEEKVHICHVMPGSVDTDLRVAALDSNKSMAPPQRKVMSASDCASRILQAARESQDEVYIPSYYKFATLVSVYCPGFISYFAKKKYNYPNYLLAIDSLDWLFLDQYFVLHKVSGLYESFEDQSFSCFYLLYYRVRDT